MASKRKSWAEKMDHPSSPGIKRTEKDFADIPAGSLMLIPTPRLIEKYLKLSTPGQKADMRQMRTDLAAENGAEFTCPLTSGIFLRILTEYTNEQREAGVPFEKLTPVWRLVNRSMPLWNKLGFDKNWLTEARQKEGIA